jgi:S-DNA-T family DNA segregation ATPase FtsK/SpoIIIE
MGKISSPKIGLIVGILLISISIFLLIAFASYLINGQSDQSLVMNNPDQAIRDAAKESQNWLGYLGAQASHWMIFRWFGIAAFLFPPFLFLLGFKWAFKVSIISLTKYTTFAMFFTFWIGLLTGYLVILIEGYSFWSFLSGGFGYELALLSADFLSGGTFLLLGGSLLIFVILQFDINELRWFTPSEKVQNEDTEQKSVSKSKEELAVLGEPEEENVEDWIIKDEKESEIIPVKTQEFDLQVISEIKPESLSLQIDDEDLFDVPQVNLLDEIGDETEQVGNNFSVAKPIGEKTALEVENLDPYDPTLELPNYKYQHPL